MKVEPVLKNEPGIIEYSIDLEHQDKLVTISSDGTDINWIITKFKTVGYTAEIQQ